MSRNARVAIAFTFGAALLTTGLLLFWYQDDLANRAWASGYVGRNAHSDLADIANALVLAGLLAQVAALHAWITSPSVDR